MTDLVKIAKERLDTLETQIGKLEDFIRMADSLLKHSLSNANEAPATDDERSAEADERSAEPTDSTYDEVLRPLTEGSDVEAEDEEPPTRKLKAAERLRKSRAIHKEPAPERRYLSLGRLHP